MKGHLICCEIWMKEFPKSTSINDQAHACMIFIGRRRMWFLLNGMDGRNIVQIDRSKFSLFKGSGRACIRRQILKELIVSMCKDNGTCKCKYGDWARTMQVLYATPLIFIIQITMLKRCLLKLHCEEITCWSLKSTRSLCHWNSKSVGKVFNVLSTLENLLPHEISFYIFQVKN